MKIYEKKALGSKEGIFLRRLCLTQYHKNILFKKSANIEVFVRELKDEFISEHYIRKIIIQLIEVEALKLHKISEGMEYYYIDEELLWSLLRKDPTFKLDEQIIENKYYIIEK